MVAGHAGCQRAVNAGPAGAEEDQSRDKQVFVQLPSRGELFRQRAGAFADLAVQIQRHEQGTEHRGRFSVLSQKVRKVSDFSPNLEKTHEDGPFVLTGY